MSISGNLKTMQLAELLQWLSQSQKTGTLVINSGKVEKRIFMQKGRLASSASNDPREYLGHFLVSHGLITEEQLSAAIKMQEEKKMLLGKILVTQEAVTEEHLQKLLRLKAEESIYDIFTWPEGEFRFVDEEVPEKMMIPLNLEITGIIMEGARRVDEWGRIRDLIPSKDAVAVLVGDPEDPNLSPAARRILSAVNDDRTVEEIQLQTHSSEFHVCSVLFDQIKAKRIKVVKPRILRVEVPVAAAPGTQPADAQQAPPQAPPAPQHPQPAQHPHPQQSGPPQGAPPAEMHHQQQYYQQPMMPPGGYPGYPQMPPQGYGPQGYPPNAGGMPPGMGHNPYGQPNQPLGGGSHYPAAPAPAAAPPAAAGGAESGSFDKLDPDAMLKAASERIAQRDFERAIRYLRAARSLRPDDRNLGNAVESAERQVRTKIEQSGITLSAVPKLAVPMEKLTSLNVSAQEGFILTRVDGRYDIKSILRISPMPEIDALILFWSLHQAGHIKL